MPENQCGMLSRTHPPYTDNLQHAVVFIPKWYSLGALFQSIGLCSVCIKDRDQTHAKVSFSHRKRDSQACAAGHAPFEQEHKKRQLCSSSSSPLVREMLLVTCTYKAQNRKNLLNMAINSIIHIYPDFLYLTEAVT